MRSRRLHSRCLIGIWWLLLMIVYGGFSSAAPVLVGLTQVQDAPALLSAVGGKPLRSFDKIRVILADIPSEQMATLRGKSGVRFAENDAQTRKLGSAEELPWGVDKIGGPAAWKISQGKGVRVAMLDTGIDVTHYDLQVQGGYTARGIDGDYLVDLDGHGTHVAGIVGARRNNIGVMGVAPLAELYAVKVLDDTGVGTISTLIDGLLWAVENRMQVANMSLGTVMDSQALREAVELAYDNGMMLVAAAGNRGNKGGRKDAVEFPAAYAPVIAVGAVDQTDVRASFSATGPALELVAPGVRIKSTFSGGALATGSGTSLASPHVTGTAALVWAANPQWTNRQVRERLVATAQRVGDGDPCRYGRGRIDAAAAVGTRQDKAEPSVGITVAMKASSPVAAVGDVETITVKATSVSGSVSAATVILTVYTPAGSSFTTNGYTDERGEAVFRLRARKKDGQGIYGLRAQVRKSGYVDGVLRLASAFAVE